MPDETIERPALAEIFRERTAIDAALTAAARDAVLRHKKLGQSIVVWRDGRSTTIPAQEIPLPSVPQAPADPSTTAA